MNSGINQAYSLENNAVLLTDIHTIGSALVIAPHPDDESLGCGGTIAQLRAMGYAVHVVFVSDGTMSHPNSIAYPANRLRDLRESEARDALQILGVEAGACTFLRFRDRDVPGKDSPGFLEAATVLASLIDRLKPSTVFVPWRRDPHPDHRSSWQILNEARQYSHWQPRVLEYLIWLWELGTPADMPDPAEVTLWTVPIDAVLEQRNQAIAAHRSQVTRLIDDDPTAFYLSPELLTHFDRPRELFLESLT
ncbi:PIG-L deacetylase family protein [Spirosoma utsteinense]|uniref:LmbE family N-acetylglucosaminyl deacetylase n=1 Tax=Spirosoma utsteinense TaxID=2585773 RepID=A0ABR6WC06_9BACT|nr:PIG-L deacetylase family protein [Spirosoma utsteinense]MBC3787579.1 LmbE family N-acetylglucosaminyl deacetylase [Spirosoma utsteinense]MBC3794105.1 LmbE family N-acetylglucosaminyl deacetylase [Spirosoma utsteinense]